MNPEQRTTDAASNEGARVAHLHLGRRRCCGRDLATIGAPRGQAPWRRTLVVAWHHNIAQKSLRLTSHYWRQVPWRRTNAGDVADRIRCRALIGCSAQFGFKRELRRRYRACPGRAPIVRRYDRVRHPGRGGCGPVLRPFSRPQSAHFNLDAIVLSERRDGRDESRAAHDGCGLE